jgi:glycerol-3-phosphate dehydrogenase
MWQGNWRQRIWSRLDQPWDVIVIGGGITGAGILREAIRLGLRTLLVEQRDFAWGTSSRSSKLVHGGLRYLKEGRIDLTRASVLERERLLAEGPGLIDPLGFLLTIYEGDFPGRWTFEAGLMIYDLLALHWGHRYYCANDFQMLSPHIAQRGLEGGFRYGDAQTDDARLVFRLIQEAGADGGVAINYVAGTELLREHEQVVGVRLQDNLDETRTADVYARVVINATGAWADQLRGQINVPARIRPLRGSHLIFPAWRLPVAQAVSFLHPSDRRPVFIFPWEGITLVGTTDVDHHAPLNLEPGISPGEVSYLMAAVKAQFPSLGIGLEDVISTFAGVRPVIGTGKADPSQESRDHVVWDESGLLTVTGGKLTTFRLIALDALDAVRHRLPDMPESAGEIPVLNPVDPTLLTGSGLAEPVRRRLLGRYGNRALNLVEAAIPGELEPIPGTQTLWGELRWAARSEGVCHLEDLLLRRVRLGLLLPHGGKAILPVVSEICHAELGWSADRWQSEQAAYLELWQQCYALPEEAVKLGWELGQEEPRDEDQPKRSATRRKLVRRSLVVGGLLGAAITLWVFYHQRKKNVIPG